MKNTKFKTADRSRNLPNFIILALIIFMFQAIKAEEIGLGKHAPSKPDVCKFVVESAVKYQTMSPLR